MAENYIVNNKRQKVSGITVIAFLPIIIICIVLTIVFANNNFVFLCIIADLVAFSVFLSALYVYEETKFKNQIKDYLNSNNNSSVMAEICELYLNKELDVHLFRYGFRISGFVIRCIKGKPFCSLTGHNHKEQFVVEIFEDCFKYHIGLDIIGEEEIDEKEWKHVDFTKIGIGINFDQLLCYIKENCLKEHFA